MQCKRRTKQATGTLRVRLALLANGKRFNCKIRRRLKTCVRRDHQFRPSPSFSSSTRSLLQPFFAFANETLYSSLPMLWTPLAHRFGCAASQQTHQLTALSARLSGGWRLDLPRLARGRQIALLTGELRWVPCLRLLLLLLLLPPGLVLFPLLILCPVVWKPLLLLLLRL